nr:reverse transcriptase domain-containing protein [Tanacetum cinerariifolium]
PMFWGNDCRLWGVVWSSGNGGKTRIEGLQVMVGKTVQCRNHRRSKKPFILKESPIDTMADQRTMAELLRAPTEGYAEAIMDPSILAEQFELKHSLINMMTSDQFFGLEKDSPYDHIRWGSPPVA